MPSKSRLPSTGSGPWFWASGDMHPVFAAQMAKHSDEQITIFWAGLTSGEELADFFEQAGRLVSQDVNRVFSTFAMHGTEASSLPKTSKLSRPVDLVRSPDFLRFECLVEDGPTPRTALGTWARLNSLNGDEMDAIGVHLGTADLSTNGDLSPLSEMLAQFIAKTAQSRPYFSTVRDDLIRLEEAVAVDRPAAMA